MQARTPESEKVAEAIRAGMKRQGLSGADLAAKLAEIRGDRPDAMWMTRRLQGSVHLVKPVMVQTGWRATDELCEIAEALNVPVEQLMGDLRSNTE